jgi:3-hydroxyisobutyrate dehydrogenase
MTISNVAVLGLGIMGAGMAGQLVQKGFSVSVWNRNPDKSAPLGNAGARVAAAPADAVADADVVVAMLAHDDASRAVWLGPDGALAALRPGAVAIEASTLTHDWVKELAGETAARGVAFLDAPVTGSRQQASEGALRFLVGGDAATIDRARPVFDAMGNGVEHLGPVGSGALVKIANNFLCGVQVASLAEAVALLERNGVDIEQSMDVILNGAPASPIVKALTRRMLNRAYEPHFFVPLMAKDLDYAGRTLAAASIPSDIAAAARQRFLNAAADGEQDHDIAAVIEPLRKAKG